MKVEIVMKSGRMEKVVIEKENQHYYYFGIESFDDLINYVLTERKNDGVVRFGNIVIMASEIESVTEVKESKFDEKLEIIKQFANE